MRLQNKRVLITGSGAGIGRATALKMAQEGALVAIADLREAAAQETAALVTAAGGQAYAFSVDVAEEGSVAALMTAVDDKLHGLDILVNNAGLVHPGDNGLEDTPLAAWNKTLAVNLTGVFLCAKQALPLLLQSGRGAMVNIASVVALVGSAYPQIAYTAAKGGVLAMTREIAVLYARQGLRCNAVCPGPVDTALARAFFDSENKWLSRRRYMPRGRLGNVEEIANVISFLASDEAAYMNGAAVPVDGGISAAYVIRDESGGMDFSDLALG